MSKAELELIPDLERVIREPECFWMTGLPKSTRAFMEKKGQFPKHLVLGPKICAWRLSEVQEWIKTGHSKPTLFKSHPLLQAGFFIGFLLMKKFIEPTPEHLMIY
ncbi:AlpA family phage regulatory protein [Klebsiella pneumoniae]|uniref:AlpA family phage regulatory protein n=1 Tax=Klebsiella pneumoniae TaxID=573 RepID=UPI00294AE79B|nr:AlpA family phage regulatory protein [Klebsiella pneumoniae]